MSDTEAKAETKTTKLTEAELMTWKYLAERQAHIQTQFASAQAALQAHFAQLGKIHALLPGDQVDPNTGVIVRAPPPVSEALTP